MRTFVFFLFASFVIFVSASCVAFAQSNFVAGDGFDSESGRGNGETIDGLDEELPFIYGVAVVHDMFLSYPYAVSIHSVWLDNTSDWDNEDITVHFNYTFVGEIEVDGTQFVERHAGFGMSMQANTIRIGDSAMNYTSAVLGVEITFFRPTRS